MVLEMRFIICGGGEYQYNQPVLVFMDKSIKQYVSMLGILCSGNYYVPLDTKMPVERLNNILKTIDASCALSDKSFDNKLIESGYTGEILHIDDLLSEIPEEVVENHFELTDRDPAYVLFTSGSTGIPKGVVISHRAVIDYIEWQNKTLPIDASSIIGSQAPFYFDASVPDIYTPISTGAELCLIPEKYFVFQNALINFINENNINTLIWVPSALINLCENKDFYNSGINDLRLIMFCGETMPTKHLNIWKNKYPDAVYVNLYGPTEATYACSYYIVNRDFANDEAMPIGRACENSRIILIDDENKLVTNEGEYGEICISGSCLMNGYFKMPEKTDEVLTQNPIVTEYSELIYHTGDIAEYNSYHEINFIGRKDFQIKHRGYRIELGEIETAGYNIPEVLQNCVVYLEDIDEIIAFYKVNNIDEKAVYHALKKKVPKYMLPSKIIIIDDFPLTANKKIDRKKLVENYLKY